MTSIEEEKKQLEIEKLRIEIQTAKAQQKSFFLKHLSTLTPIISVLGLVIGTWRFTSQQDTTRKEKNLQLVRSHIKELISHSNEGSLPSARVKIIFNDLKLYISQEGRQEYLYSSLTHILSNFSSYSTAQCEIAKSAFYVEGFEGYLSNYFGSAGLIATMASNKLAKYRKENPDFVKGILYSEQHSSFYFPPIRFSNLNGEEFSHENFLCSVITLSKYGQLAKDPYDQQEILNHIQYLTKENHKLFSVLLFESSTEGLQFCFVEDCPKKNVE